MSIDELEAAYSHLLDALALAMADEDGLLAFFIQMALCEVHERVRGATAA